MVRCELFGQGVFSAASFCSKTECLLKREWGEVKQTQRPKFNASLVLTDVRTGVRTDVVTGSVKFEWVSGWGRGPTN